MNEENKKHANLEIYVRKNDPYFHRTMKHKANAYHLAGFVETRTDGSIYVELEGEEGNIEKFLKDYREGDESETIIRLDAAYTHDFRDFDSFIIKDNS